MESSSCLLLCLAALVSYGGAGLTPIPEPEEAEVVFARDLHPDFTPCREWTFPCDGGRQMCTTQEEYAFFLTRPPLCPTFEDPTPETPSGVCALVDGECTFTEDTVPSCVSWLSSGCDQEYSCTTELDFLARGNATCPMFNPPPPTPDQVCVSQSGECQRYNPCTIWRGHCLGPYNCGTFLELGEFQAGPIPICIPPNIFTPQHLPEGECLYRDGECEWSQCRAWLDHCRTSWRCGSEYDFQVFNSLPAPPCANPGPFFVPPSQPGVCQYNLTLGRCDFFDVGCKGGKEFTECGSLCPLTCDDVTRGSSPFCPSLCVPGCFCPTGTVLHNDSCISPNLCPGINPCDPNPCEPNQDCKVIDPPPCLSLPCPPPLGACVDREPGPCELFPCEPGFDCFPLNFPCDEPPCPPPLAECVDFHPCDPSPCNEDEECREKQVQCPRAPCPPVAECRDKVVVDVRPFETGVRVTVNYAGAYSIRVIVRDRFDTRYTKTEQSSSVTFTFPNLPLGLIRTRANIRTEDGEKIISEWIRLFID